MRPIPLSMGRLPVRFALFAALVVGGPASGQVWQDHAPLPFETANNAVASHRIADTTFVYTFMGIDSTKIWSGIHLGAARLNTVTNTWETLPDVPLTFPKIAAVAAAVGDSIYLMGGYRVGESGQEISANGVVIFDALTKSWVGNASPMLLRNDDMVAGVWSDSLIVLVSGWSNTANTQAVQIYDRTTDTWSMGTPVPDYGTFGAVGGICGDHIVYVDGVADTATFAFDLVNRVLVGSIDPLDATNITWEDRGAHAGPPVYRGASGNVPGDDTRILFAGGSDNPYNFDGIGYDGNPSVPLPDVWSYHVPTGTVVFHGDKPTPTMDHRGFPAADGRLYVVGGMEANPLVTTRVSSWLPDVVTGAPVLAESLPEIRAFPNPTAERVRFAAARGAPLGDAQIYDVSGRVVRSWGERTFEGGLEWNLTTTAGRRVAPGRYWLLARADGRRVALSVTVLAP